MTKTVNLQDKDGAQIRAVEVRFGGDTIAECEQAKRKFARDRKAFMKYATAAVKDGTTADGRARSLVGRVAMQTAEQKLKKMLDATFGEEVYPAFFDMARPFAAVGGRFYVSNVLDTLEQITVEMIGGFLTNE